jgi:hypothetical protein
MVNEALAAMVGAEESLTLRIPVTRSRLIGTTAH